jgi:hypothetical protein
MLTRYTGFRHARRICRLPPFLGFALVTHNQPKQIALLCHKLFTMFDNPPITIHHDYSKCELDPASLPPQTKIVKDWIATRWGDATVIDAYLAALRLLHAQDGPEWTYSLSAADYPIKSAGQILTSLREASADGFVDFRGISEGCLQAADARSIASAFSRPEYMDLARQRYLSFSIIPRFILKRVGNPNRTLYLRGDLHVRWLTPFSATVRPFAGDWWHTLNRRAVAVLIEDTLESRQLRRYYEHLPSPEESYYQTLLLNRPDLHIENDNRRFTVWNQGKAHPNLLGFHDISNLVDSPAHFARKFPFDPALYSALDAAVSAAAPQPANIVGKEVIQIDDKST